MLKALEKHKGEQNNVGQGTAMWTQPLLVLKGWPTYSCKPTTGQGPQGVELLGQVEGREEVPCLLTRHAVSALLPSLGPIQL